MNDIPEDPARRRLFAQSIPAGASLVTGFALASSARADSAAAEPAGARFVVTDYGAVGDGQTPSAEAFQRAIDAAEAVGGGIVEVPAGIFILERTPLIASRVHLVGTGRASVLRGERPDPHRGAALISNKGQQAAGYDGATDWSISHVAIDSPKTNGIGINHAARVYLGWIHGIEVYEHFVDNIGCDVLCENLFLTGRSGTSAFQIDSLTGAETIWGGEREVAPKHDGTQARNLILRDSFITAQAGHNGDKPKHFCSLHFHGEQSAGFIFSNLVLGGALVGIYQDAGSHYADIQIDNLRSTNPQAAALFNGGSTGQRGLIIRGLMHVPEPTPEATDVTSGGGLVIVGHDDVIVADTQLLNPAASASTAAVMVSGCHNVRISGLQARGDAGTGIAIDPHGEDGEPEAGSDDVMVQGCQLNGFSTGIAAPSPARGRIATGLNQYSGVARPVAGQFQQGNEAPSHGSSESSVPASGRDQA